MDRESVKLLFMRPIADEVQLAAKKPKENPVIPYNMITAGRN